MAGKVRSPNYPAFDLGEAIQRARQLYEQEGTAHTPPEIAVTAWGYNSLNGASARVLSAVRQYGLVEDVGRDVRVSERALAILLDPEGSAEYQEALRAAAREPGVFAEILDEYPNGLPSDQTVVAHLVRKRGFTEDGAKKLNAVLRATLDLVSRSDGRYIREEEPERSGPAQQDGGKALAQVASAAPDRVPETETGAVRGRLVAPPGGYMTHYEHALLSKGAVATLSLAYEKLTPDDVEELYDWLDLLRRSIERRIRLGQESDRSAPVDAAESAASTGELDRE